MDVSELMTRNVVTVRPDTPLKKVAATLVRHGISGAPVVDDGGAVVGVVSETDIVERERGAGRVRFDLLAWLSESEGPALDVKLRARTAGEAMTSPAVTIGPHASLAKAAAFMVDRGVNRLPVVTKEGKLVGIVSRRDLVRAFTRTDAELEHEVRDDVVAGWFWIEPASLAITVVHGTVEIAGEVESEDVAERLVATIERVPGVLAVRSELTWPEPEVRRRPLHRLLFRGVRNGKKRIRS